MSDADARRRRSSCAPSCSRPSTRTTLSTVEFRKAADILGGLWEKVRERPREFLDGRTLEREGVDAAARDFLAGMTDRYAVGALRALFIPKPWVDVPRDWERD